ncbi:prepilin peptidase [Cellulomonas soli]
MTTNTDSATLALTALLLLPLGLAVGSFLNVVIWRVPQGMSVVRPPSACPRCEHPIRGRDNVPVLSWLLLRGRCRDCRAPISIRYPLVETATGILFVASGLFAGPTWVLPALLYLVSITVALVLIDIDTRRLPDTIVLPSYLVTLALLSLASWNPGARPTGVPCCARSSAAPRCTRCTS